MMIRRVFLVFLVLGVMACGEDGAGPDLIGTDLPGTLGLGDPDQVNLITPPVTYGATPSVVDEIRPPETLVAGVTYELILWRALRENSTAVCQSQFENGCLLAVHEFVR